jgi:chorismate mutase
MASKPAVRGIRGATTVQHNTREEIFARTQELVLAMLRENDVRVDDIAAAFFTLTPDLDADFPAYAARDLAARPGMAAWRWVPMMCASEIGVPGGMSRVVRVLLLVNTPRPPAKIRHQYLGGTACLRPDLAPTANGRTPSRRPSRNSPNTRASDGARP